MGWKAQSKGLGEALRGSDGNEGSVWEGARERISMRGGDFIRERGAVKVRLVRGGVLGCWARRGSTFGAGQRLLAQGAEAEVLVKAAGPGLFQHPWAPIHPMKLEEAPSLQLG